LLLGKEKEFQAINQCFVLDRIDSLGTICDKAFTFVTVTSYSGKSLLDIALSIESIVNDQADAMLFCSVVKPS
jgi:hypothetical protein